MWWVFLGFNDKFWIWSGYYIYSVLWTLGYIGYEALNEWRYDTNYSVESVIDFYQQCGFLKKKK